MIENATIWAPQVSDDQPSIIEIPTSERERVAKKLKSLDELWQINMDKSAIENSYDNDDYLFVADMLQDIRELHTKIYYNPYQEKWMRGNREIPYIHLDFINQAALKHDDKGNLVFDDKKLNMGVCLPFQNGTHALKFNYYWLKRYLSFLQVIFDSNEEEVFTLPPDTQYSGVAEYKTKKEIREISRDLIRQGLSEQAKTLMEYSNSFLDNNRIEMPILAFLNIPNEKQVATWSLYDKNTNSFKIPMKKTIYNTSGFSRLFERRNELVSELFINSLKMILAHETAHVARGHWLLRINEPKYSMQRNVMMNCEINADWTATHWLLNEILYDTVDGNPYNPILAYSKETLIYTLSIRILAIYLSLSWMQQDENDRVWTAATIRNFVSKDNATHPIYQFRLYCALGHIKEHLDHMAKQNNKEGNPLVTADGQPLSQDLFDEIWYRACDMIFSFEYAFRECWEEDERSDLEKIREGLFIDDNAIPNQKEKIPFFMCHMKAAQDELAEYEKQWKEILDKLRNYGMYFRM